MALACGLTSRSEIRAEASLVDWRRAEMVRTGRPNIFSARDLPPRSPIGIERYTCKS
ncbi:hypothetical protein pipiens_013645, partial [Culex pipiens pipiens]